MQGIRFDGTFRLTVYYQGAVLMQFSNPNVNFNIDFDADIVKDGFKNGNTRNSIFIYNLSSDKRNTLQALISESRQTSMQFMIEVSIPYMEDQFEVITYDDIVGVYSELGESDYKTQLILKSGEASAIEQYSSVSFPPGATLSQVMNLECQSLVDGDSITNFNTQNMQDHTFPYGIAYVGNTFSQIKKLAYEYNNTAFIDKGVLYIAQNNWIPVSNQVIQQLNYSNGLLESPTVGQANYSKKYNLNQGAVAFQFKTLILPTVNINDVLNVMGVYFTIKRISHTINSREGIAYSVMEGYQNDAV